MNEFRIKVVELLDNGGIKGYNAALRSICKALPHALGEIIYKVVRYHAKHDLRDLVKIAAWAELEWESENANGARGAAGNQARARFARALDSRHIAGSFDLMPRDSGGGAGGARRGEIAPARYPKNSIAYEPESRTGASGGRRGPVDKQHRRATRKGKP